MRRLATIVGLGYAALVAAACAQVIGIEDAEVDPSFADPCVEYCDTVERACKSDVMGEYVQYAGPEACRNICAIFEPGDPNDEIRNTVQCRLTNAKAAEATQEPAVHCPLAGPGGVDVDGNGCGDRCESYCLMMQSVCPADFRGEFNEDLNGCQTACRGFQDSMIPFDIRQSEGDTIQCRLYHLGAATIDPGTHCPHAIGQDPCVDMGTGGAGGAGGAGGSGGN